MNIGDLFFALRADGARFTTEVVKEAEKAGDAGGKTLGGRLATAASRTLKAGLATFGAVAAFATKGLVELDDIQQQFAADTGATADEAKAAGKAILEMSSRNLQPMRAIGDALTKVHTDLGLTGDLADKVTEQFLKFSRVTKRDAAAEVASFDDILDAWGKTAGDIPGIMDQLVVSHQRYGGSIEENEAALAAMAPQLQALNMDIDDGIGLLNLFASSGLDAAAGQKALNSAITNLPAGESLDQFLVRLSKIEDPLLRAQEATKVFGAKAGAGLANAIKPGMDSLESFQVHAEDVQGAALDAAAAVDSTFGAQAQLKLKQFGAAAIGAFRDLGPAITGIASLASLAGSLGLDTLLLKLGKPLATGLLQAGKAGGQALIDGMAVAIGAAGTVIGNLVAQALDPHNPFLNGVIGKSAAALGSLWGRLFGAAAAIGNFMADLFMKLPGMAKVRGAVLAGAIQLGTLQGTTMGKAAALGFSLAIPLLVAEVASAIQGPLNKAGRDIHDAIFQGPLEGIGDGLEGVGTWLESLPWPIGPVGAPDWARGSADAEAGINQVADAIEVGGNGLVSRADKIADDLTAGWPVAITGGFDAAQQETIRGYMALGLTLEQAKAIVGPAAEVGLKDPIVDVASTIPGAAAKAVKPTARAIADSLHAARFSVKDAIEAIKQTAKDSLTPMKEMAAIEGFLAGDYLAKKLKSKKPDVRAEAEAWKVAAEDRLQALRDGVPQLALKTGQNYADALAAKQTAIKTAANTALAGARGKLIAMRADAADWGYRTGANWVDNIADGIQAGIYGTGGVYWSVGKVANILRASSPPGPASPLHHIDDWGWRTGAELPINMAKAISALAGRVRVAVGTLALAATPGPLSLGNPLAGLVAPDLAARGLSRAAQVASPNAGFGLAQAASAQGGTYSTTIVMQERKHDELEVLERASWYQRTGLINPRPLQPLEASS